MNKNEEIKKEVQKQFGSNAHKYVTSESHAKGDDLQLMIEWLQPKPAWLALDVATGGGHVAKNLAPHVKQVIATDLTHEMLKASAGEMKKAGLDNVMFLQADAESLPFLDHTFELVTCRIAAHHFPNPHLFVEQVSRVLKPGGKFLLIDNVAPDQTDMAQFINQVEKLRDPSHARCPSIGEWTEWFTQNGLTEQRSRLRKKTYPFSSWVARTSGSAEQSKRVEQFILEEKEMHDYFEIVVEAGNVTSLQTNEWMVLLEKEREAE